MSPPTRAQSEVVGIVLLTAVVVVVAAVVGTFVLSSFETDAGGEPKISIKSEINETTLVLKHNGGERYAADAVEVVLRGDTESRAFLNDGNFTAGSDPSVFEAGDVWCDYHDFGPGEIRLFVFDRESDTLLHDATLEVEQPA